jgi:hydroxyacylglutathione hydrolase
MEKINDIIVIEGIGFDSNIYVYNDLIIDTGTGENIDYVLDSLKKAGVLPQDLTMIVNTHCHYDHIGGNRYFDAKIAMHKEDADAIEKNHDLATIAYLFGRSMEEIKVDYQLKEGDKISDFKVLHTPGHTMGSICLYDGEILISGDTVFAHGGFGRVDLGGDLNLMIESLKRLNGLNVDYLFPGHGPWVDNGSKHIKLAYNILKEF